MYEAHALLRGELCGDPALTILVHDAREITRAAINHEVDRLARGLRAQFNVGDVLAVLLPNGPEILALLLACFRVGVVPMPLSPDLKAFELQQILEQAQVDALVTTSGLRRRHSMLEPVIGSIWIVSQGTSPFPDSCEPSWDEQQLSAEDDRPVLVLHTSGSSGTPKLVVLSYRSLLDVLEYRLTHCALDSTSVSVVASCVSQTVGLYQTLALLAAGATVVMLDSYDIDAMVEAIQKYEPTHLIFVVGAWDQLLHHPQIAANDLAALKFASAGSDRLTPRVQERFHALTGRYLRASYGLTESSWALVNNAECPGKSLALGRPCPGSQARLLDSQGAEVARGDVGELHVRSPRNFLRYLHDPDATRSALADGWLATGDLAYQDCDGDFWFAGRCKDLIVLATGDNVSPAQVEAVLGTHPAVADCLVVSRSTRAGSLVPWALVISNYETTVEELREFLSQRISDFKVPAGIEFVSSFPVGLSGKVQRSQLPHETGAELR